MNFPLFGMSNFEVVIEDWDDENDSDYDTEDEDDVISDDEDDDDDYFNDLNQDLSNYEDRSERVRVPNSRYQN